MPVEKRLFSKNTLCLLIVFIIATTILLLISSRQSSRDNAAAPTPSITRTSSIKTIVSTDVVGPAVYAGDTFGSRFYTESGINISNVKSLKLAWRYSSGDANTGQVGPQVPMNMGFECSPIVCDNRLIVVTPTEAIVALDPSSGAELWRFEPANYSHLFQANRGPACWIGPVSDHHRYRILYSSWRNLYELDATTGKPIDEFGDHGTIDLSEGLDRGHPEMMRFNSPPLIVGNTAICGGQINDNFRTYAPSGDVRAYDIHSGKIIWTFHPIPVDHTDPASKTWLDRSAARTGGANVWSMMSYDPKSGLAYLPTSSPSNDFYGGTRPGIGLYADSIVCINAATGKVKWFYQLVHHNLWDYDIPAEPLLFNYRRGNNLIPAVAVATKMGRIFLFNRMTGVPLFPIKEVAVPKSNVPGEWTSPTQPMQVLPPPLVAQAGSSYNVTESNPSEFTNTSEFPGKIAMGSIYTPPSLNGFVQFPGFLGGCNWAGMTYDKASGLIITTANNLGHYIRLYSKANEQPKENPMIGTPYWVLTREYWDNNKVPLTKPPWGIIVGIDPVTGQIRWKHPLGYLPQANKIPGYQHLGSLVVGGCVSTATDLVFVAGTSDSHLRALKGSTGKELASFTLPNVGAALPIIYSVKGREYVVICCGGHGAFNTDHKDQVLAFSL